MLSRILCYFRRRRPARKVVAIRLPAGYPTSPGPFQFLADVLSAVRAGRPSEDDLVFLWNLAYFIASEDATTNRWRILKHNGEWTSITTVIRAWGPLPGAWIRENVRMWHTYGWSRVEEIRVGNLYLFVTPPRTATVLLHDVPSPCFPPYDTDPRVFRWGL